MFTVSPEFLEETRSSYQRPIVRVDAYRGSGIVMADLPVTTGSVDYDQSSQVRRTCRMVLGDEELFPRNPSSPLAPFGTELRVYRGFRYLTGQIEMVPCGIYRIDRIASKLVAGGVSIVGNDRAKAVADDKFTQPESAVEGNIIPDEMIRLARHSLPALSAANASPSTSLVPRSVWDQERWQAIEDLAKSIGAEVFFSTEGTMIIRAVPTIDDTPVSWLASVGQQGNILDGDDALSREGVYSVVVARGERADDTPPVHATVEDTDPTSPTWVDGDFGRVTTFYDSPLLTTTEQCITAATAILARKKLPSREVSLDVVCNPAVDVGDVVNVLFPSGSQELHLIEKLSIPLDVTDSMKVSFRSNKDVE